MAELTPKGQAASRASQTAKRCRKRFRTIERKAAETKLETAKSEQLRRSEGASLPAPKKIWGLPPKTQRPRVPVRDARHGNYAVFCLAMLKRETGGTNLT